MNYNEFDTPDINLLKLLLQHLLKKKENVFVIFFFKFNVQDTFFHQSLSAEQTPQHAEY